MGRLLHWYSEQGEAAAPPSPLLYIVDWRMVVVVGGNVLHHVKRRGIVQEREMSGGIIL